MHFTRTSLPGVIIVEPEPARDSRGLFARTFSAEEFSEHGIHPAVAQCSTSFNTAAHTLRGLHYQTGAAGEDKLVRCTRGAAWDVAVDLRPDSPSFRRWVGVELTADNRRAVRIPPGCAHGFLTLEDATEVFYQISTAYSPAHGRGVRWDDPEIGIVWPAAPRVISERDASWDYLPA